MWKHQVANDSLHFIIIITEVQSVFPNLRVTSDIAKSSASHCRPHTLTSLHLETIYFLIKMFSFKTIKSTAEELGWTKVLWLAVPSWKDDPVTHNVVQ